MSLTVNSGPVLGTVGVTVTQGRGLNANELTDMAMARLIHIGDNAPPAIREQGLAFQQQMRVIVGHYVAQAQRSERTTIANVLRRAGQFDAAALVETY